MFRLIRYFAIALVVLLGLWYLLGRTMGIPSIRELFSAPPLQIEKTPLLVSGMRELAELTTISAEDQVVVDTQFIDPTASGIRDLIGLNGGLPGYRKLVLIVRGRVWAGTNLAGLNETAIFRKGDSVRLVLPRARIAEIIVNPSDVETFIEVGKWPTSAYEQVKIKAREKIRLRAIEQGILRKADDRAKLLMELFLRKAGFQKVSILIE